MTFYASVAAYKAKSSHDFSGERCRNGKETEDQHITCDAFYNRGEDATATKSSAQMSTVAQASCSGYLPGQGRKTAQAHGLGPTWAACKICIK